MRVATTSPAWPGCGQTTVLGAPGIRQSAGRQRHDRGCGWIVGLSPDNPAATHETAPASGFENATSHAPQLTSSRRAGGRGSSGTAWDAGDPSINRGDRLRRRLPGCFRQGWCRSPGRGRAALRGQRCIRRAKSSISPPYSTSRSMLRTSTATPLHNSRGSLSPHRAVARSRPARLERQPAPICSYRPRISASGTSNARMTAPTAASAMTQARTCGQPRRTPVGVGQGPGWRAPTLAAPAIPAAGGAADGAVAYRITASSSSMWQ